MRLLPNQNVLGIAVGERSLRLAEVGPSRTARGRWEVRRVAEFVPATGPGAAGGGGAGEPLPAAAGDAEKSGAEFARFLRDNGFTAPRAVVGVPARWLVAREKELPPSSPEQAADVLRLQAERSFSSELGDLAYDYAGVPDPATATNVLLVAMPRRQLDRVVQLVKAAGRDVAAVVPTTLALAAAPAGEGTDKGGGDGLLLSVTADAVELVARAGGVPRLLRHLSVRGPDLVSRNGTRAAAVAALAGEIKRALAVMPGAKPQGPGRPLHLWDGVGLGEQETTSLGQQLGTEIRPHSGLGGMRMAPAGPAPLPAAADTVRFAPAAALALAGTVRQPGLVDFLHPRLAAPVKRRVGRASVWAAAVGATAVIALLALWLDVRSREAALADLQSRLVAMRPDLESAEAKTERVRTARGWFGEGRTPVLECLREVTLAFPDGEPVYVTSLTFREDRKGQLVGRAPNQSSVLAVMDGLKTSKKFSGVELVDMRNAGGGSREVSFSLSFVFADEADAARATAAPPTPPARPLPRAGGSAGAPLTPRTPAPRNTREGGADRPVTSDQ